MNFLERYEISNIKKNNFLTLDLEYTSWKDSIKNKWSKSNQFREIVQIGIYAQNGTNSISFNKYFLPEINPSLSLYFQNLTNISNSFLEKNKSNYIDALIEIEQITSNYDFILCIGSDKSVLIENNDLKNISIQFNFFEKIFDIRPVIANYLGLNESKIISSELPSYFSIPLENEMKHSAIYDAECSFKAILKIIDDVDKDKSKEANKKKK